MNHEGSTHFTWDDRLTLERMLKQGFKKPEIAKALLEQKESRQSATRGEHREAPGRDRQAGKVRALGNG